MATASVSYTFEIPAENEELREATSWQQMSTANWEAKQLIFRQVDENDTGLNWTPKQLQFLNQVMGVLNWDK
jgi:hypothetical protein